MPILYVSTHCPYCHKVQNFINEQGVACEIRNVQDNTAHRDDVLRLGGKMQVPFLVDTEKNVSMYESDDIIAHLSTTCVHSAYAKFST